MTFQKPCGSFQTFFLNHYHLSKQCNFNCDLTILGSLPEACDRGLWCHLGERNFRFGKKKDRSHEKAKPDQKNFRNVANKGKYISFHLLSHIKELALLLLSEDWELMLVIPFKIQGNNTPLIILNWLYIVLQHFTMTSNTYQTKT